MTRRILAWIAALAAIIVALALATAAWQFSDELSEELLVAPELVAGSVVDVLTVGDGTVTLALTNESLISGIWGLATPSSYGRIGGVVDSGDATITRTYVGVEGELVPGPAMLDQLAFRGDPQRALGARYEAVTVDGRLGPMPAWLIDGELGVWVIYVHGAGGRADALRPIQVAVDEGHPVLVITYRNDPGAPAAPDGRVSWGFDEWEDVEAGIEFALGAGAEDVYLMGSGIGGSAVLVTLDETSHIRSIRGAVLDSPILDLAAVEEARKPNAGLIGSLGRTLASWRFGVEWSRLDHAARADDLRRPVLLLQGGRDPLVPLAVADAFATAGGDLVEYHRFDEAGHGQAWNVALGRYTALVAGFLTEHLPEEG